MSLGLIVVLIDSLMMEIRRGFGLVTRANIVGWGSYLKLWFDD